MIQGRGRGTVITVHSDSVTLRNLQVRGDGGRLKRDDAVIKLTNSRNSSVVNCDIKARAFGIYVYSGGNHRLRGNRVRGTSRLKRNERGNGIHLWETENNRLVGNHVTGTRDGIYLSFAHESVLKENVGYDLRYGIHYMYSERNKLIENRFRRNEGGVALMYSRDNVIRKNRSISNREFGVLLLQLEQSDLTANRVRKNKRGFFVQNSVNNRFRNNRISGNHVGMYLSAGSRSNRIYANGFIRNNVPVVLKGSHDNQWSRERRGNYWEGYAWMDRNADGIGDRPWPITDLKDRLIAQYPRLVLFLHSPLYHLAGYLFRRVIGTGGEVEDPYPLMNPPEEKYDS